MEHFKFLELVNKRSSIRKYLPKIVPRQAIDRCLEASRLAPSACNSQPWHFIVLDDRQIISEFCDKVFSGIYAFNSFVRNAPVIIAVVTERSRYIAQMAGYFRGVQYSLIDIGIACEHLILQAEEEGLGTCWLGWFNEKEAKEFLDVPKDKKIDVMITLGFADREPKEKVRRALDETREFYKK